MRRSVNILGWMALALVMGGWFAFLRPPVLGGNTELVVVNGDSMLPTYESGDLVVTRTSDHYSTGDVVAFKTAGGQTRVIHRVVGDSSEGLSTQGDNRTSTDPWTPSAADVTGRAVVHVHSLGSVMVSLSRSPFAMAGAAGIAAFLGVIWPEKRTGSRPARHRRWNGGAGPTPASFTRCTSRKVIGRRRRAR
jgi:signal peptidase